MYFGESRAQKIVYSIISPASITIIILTSCLIANCVNSKLIASILKLIEASNLIAIAAANNRYSKNRSNSCNCYLSLALVFRSNNINLIGSSKLYANERSLINSLVIDSITIIAIDDDGWIISTSKYDDVS